MIKKFDWDLVYLLLYFQFTILGGTVSVGKDKGIELNNNSTHLMRADV
jgi:hypothetical protein